MAKLVVHSSSTVAFLTLITALFLGMNAYAEAQAQGGGAPNSGYSANNTAPNSGNLSATTNPGASQVIDGVSQAPMKKTIPPYRTFITIQRYNMEQSGDTRNQISNVRIKITFPNGNKVELPGGGQYWPIGNGQVQEINRTFELPFNFVQNDGFKFQVQMERKGDEFLPCQFDVIQLSEFNRSYVCHTDIGWQVQQRIAEEKQDKEGIQVRVFTDLNSKPNEIPRDSLALK